MGDRRYLKLLIAGGIVMTVFACGCGKIKSEKPTGDYRDVISKLIMKKYGLAVEVNEVTENDRNTWMDKITYKGKAQIKDSDDVFDVVISKDKETLYDNYPEIIYKDKIDELLNGIYADNPHISIQSSEYVYEVSDKNWTDEDSPDDYIKNSGSYANIVFDVNGNDIEEVAGYISDFFYELENRGFKCVASCDYSYGSKSGNIGFASIAGKELGNVSDIKYKLENSRRDW